MRIVVGAAIVLVTASLISTASTASPKDSVESARYLCALVDGTGLTSSPCEVDGFGSRVLASIDMTSSEARELCGQVRDLMVQRKRFFDRGWTLHLRSPYSGDQSIAYCDLL